MDSRTRGFFVGVLSCAVAALAVAAEQPLENFARMPQMREVVISPDGRYVAFLSSLDDTTVIATLDRQSNADFRRIAASEPGKFDVDRCVWANNDRVVCSIVGNIRSRRYAEPPFTRMMAVDADGAKLKTLDIKSQKGNPLAGTTSPQNLNNAQVSMRAGSGASVAESQDYTQKTYGEKTSRTFETISGQRSDHIIDVLPDDRDMVLIQSDDDGNGWPSVSSLNIYNGIRGARLRQNQPIRQFLANGRGDVRLGWSGGGSNPAYFARAVSATQWSPLEKLDAFARGTPLYPITIDTTKNIAFAEGAFQGRNALWSVDLTDGHDPEVLFKNDHVDAGDVLLSNDRRLIGVRYDLERPQVWYRDEALRAEMAKINARNYTGTSMLIDMTRDQQTLVIRSFSDVDDGTYYLYDRPLMKMSRLGTAYPELSPGSLGTMRAITYKASDGTDIPGYLTIPTGAHAQKLPLIVLPHDGPAERDTWQFSFLRAFLANRGYAVLQMNYRGSSGYGEKWTQDAHQSWGGLSYSDVTDATRWAIAQGIADPKRICIAGWGFGGYTALLGAERNGDLYKCAISIAGITDLQAMRDSASVFGNAGLSYVDDQLGSDAAKLTRDSPVEQAAAISVPVLLVHGDLDWRVQVEQSKKMEAALQKNRKEHTAVYLKGAGHDLDRKSDRVTLLKEVESFLQKNLGPGA